MNRLVTPTEHKLHRSMFLVSFLLVLVMLLAACGGNQPTTPSPSGHGGVISVVPSPEGAFTQNFNPFSPNSDYGTLGYCYETLLFFNRLNGQITPWLASSYNIASDAKSVTFHLRQGVKWSDGQPFSSDDVVYTLNLMKQNPALDLNSLWQTLANVSAPDSSTVLVSFKQPSSSILWYLGGQTYMVPKHIWTTLGDPSKTTNPKPVGTGPFTLKSFSSQLIDWTRNPNYWQPGKPSIDEVRYPSYNSNTSAELALDTGQLDWTSLYLPNVQQTFISRDPTHNHYWFPPASVQTLYLNTAKSPFNLLPVRQAISLAIDRNELYKIGESGFEPPASPTGLVLPNNNSYLVPQYANLTYTVDDAKANSLLQGAGFTKGSNGIYVDKSGKPLSFNLNVVTGWTDWVTDCQIIASELKTIGMQVSVNALAFNAYFSSIQLGNFDMAMSWTLPGPTPYYLYYAMLSSSNTAAVGQAATSNWERWNDPATDQLLAQYRNSVSSTVQQQAIAGLEKIMVDQLPTIPLVYDANLYEYSTAHVTGWPTANNPYAMPGAYNFPDAEIIVLNLHQA